MAEKNDTTQQNEGEGNRTAAREYNKAQHDFARSGKVEEKAREARRAVEGARARNSATPSWWASATPLRGIPRSSSRIAAKAPRRNVPLALPVVVGRGPNHVRGVAAARDLIALLQGLAPTRRILAKLAAKSGRFNRALSPPNLP